MGRDTRNVPIADANPGRFRLACPFTQSDKALPCSHKEEVDPDESINTKVKTLISLHGRVG